MTLLKRRIAGALAVISVASLITFLQVEANHETDDQIGEEAIWKASPEDLSAISQACKMTDASRYGDCFIDQMGEYASSNAVAFTQMLASQKSSRLGYLTGSREYGLVDLGYVVYPGTQKLHQGWMLLNGMPALINLDDVTALPKAAMEKDAQYAALLRSHPQMQLAINDEQRKEATAPQIERLPSEGERFAVPYSLQDPCAGCAPLAQAIFGFDFNDAGKFMGIKFLRVEKFNP
ncbi:MAG: hypothetical protein LAO76_13930 [Acidobacteriia bacterium]|nr:hypothetical protein [Terriglobia bacterium]